VHTLQRPKAALAVVAVCLMTAAALALASSAARAPVAERASLFPYGSNSFAQLVADSYRYTGAGNPTAFFDWMASGYQRFASRDIDREPPSIHQFLEANRRRLEATTNRHARAELELHIASRLHGMVKVLVPRFSLERGFEFSYAARTGERQCLLQSALIASMLQKVGARAGVVMVYRNGAGAESNNGHAAVLLKLTDGQDVIVDASDPEPLANHQGILARCSDYCYLVPIYRPGSGRRIVGYLTEAGRHKVAVARVLPLDYPYVRSQFWYYRGERAKGGLLSAQKSAEGLRVAKRCFRTSVSICPHNALATYMLGRVELAEGHVADARALLHRAYALYVRDGWVPQGPQQYLKLANTKPALVRR